MNGPEIVAAKASLAARLIQWKVPEAHVKAQAFIDDLVKHGWVAGDKARRFPPQAHEECVDHPGEYRIACRLHAADRKARRDEVVADRAEHLRLTREQAIAAAREGIRQHAPTPKETP